MPWLLLAVINGWLAKKKGHSAAVWFAVSFVGGPFATAVIVFFLEDKSGPGGPPPVRFELRE